MKRLYIILCVLCALVALAGICYAAGEFPIKNGKLQNNLDGNQKSVSNVIDIVGTGGGSITGFSSIFVGTQEVEVIIIGTGNVSSADIELWNQAVVDAITGTNYMNTSTPVQVEGGTVFDASGGTNIPSGGLRITNAWFAGAILASDDGTNWVWKVDGGGGVSLTGFELVIDSSDWIISAPDEGSRPGSNACTPVSWNTYNATNDFKTGYGVWSSQTNLQDRYFPAHIKIPSYASSLGTTAFVIEVRSTSTGIATNYADVSFKDGVNVFETNNLVSSTANEPREYYVLESQLPAAWSNGFPADRLFTVRADLHTSRSNYMGFPNIKVDWD